MRASLMMHASKSVCKDTVCKDTVCKDTVCQGYCLQVCLPRILFAKDTVCKSVCQGYCLPRILFARILFASLFAKDTEKSCVYVRVCVCVYECLENYVGQPKARQIC